MARFNSFSLKSLLHFWLAVTGLFSVAMPVAIMTGTIIGLGVLIIDKQRELAYYRYVSVGTRENKLQEEHDKLIAFMKQTPPVPKEEMEAIPIN